MRLEVAHIAKAIDNWSPFKLVKFGTGHRVMRQGFIKGVEVCESCYRGTIVIPFDSSHSWLEIEALIDIEVSHDNVKWRVWGDSHLLSKDKVEEFMDDVKVDLMALARQVCKKE